MKKLILLLAFLLTVSISYSQDNIKMVFYQKQLSKDSKLQPAVTTDLAFVKNYTEKDREKELHYHDGGMNICTTYYIYSEDKEPIKYSDKLEYVTVKASTSKTTPDNGEKIEITLWHDFVDTKLAMFIVKDGVGYMYYVETIEDTIDGYTTYQALTKW